MDNRNSLQRQKQFSRVKTRLDRGKVEVVPLSRIQPGRMGRLPFRRNLARERRNYIKLYSGVGNVRVELERYLR